MDIKISWYDTYPRFHSLYVFLGRMKFVIFSPRQVCGGPIVLHVLCKLLCEAWRDARIFYFAGAGEATSYQNKFLFWKKYAVFFVDDLKKSAKAFIARHFSD